MLLPDLLADRAPPGKEVPPRRQGESCALTKTSAHHAVMNLQPLLVTVSEIPWRLGPRHSPAGATPMALKGGILPAPLNQESTAPRSGQHKVATQFPNCVTALFGWRAPR